MMILILLFILPNVSYADIFAKPPDQATLDQTVVKDVRNSYYRGTYDYNAYAAHDDGFELNKRQISLGSSRYSFHDSLKNFLNKQEFNSIETEEIMNKLALPSSRLLFWQYSSPAVADVYKHLQTLGYIKLAMRYQQYEDFESSIDDPLIKLRKQAILDCMKKRATILQRNDIEASFQECFEDLDAKGITTYENLEDPSDGNFNISGRVYVTEKVLERVNKENLDLSVVNQIVPRVSIDQNSVYIKGPQKKDRELIFQYRGEFLSSLSSVVAKYKRDKRLNADTLKSFWVFGLPMTEGQIKNISMLGDQEGYFAMNKIASNLAYLKAIDQYLLASQMLERVMLHPAIEPGYKTLLKSSIEFVHKEITDLKQEKERLSQYADTMRNVLNEADSVREKTMKQIKEESKAQAQQGLFKLNP